MNIKIQHPALSNGIEISCDIINTIYFDECNIFYQFITDLQNDEIANEKFYISSDYTHVKTTTILECVVNLFSIEMNDKKIITGFYKKIVKQSEDDSKTIKDIQSLNTQLSYIVKNVTSNCNMPLIFDEELTLQHLLKITDLRFNFKDINFLVKLTNYIELLLEFTSIKILILPFLNNLLTEEELDTLISFTKNKNFFIITCNSQQSNIQKNKLKTIYKEKEEKDIII
ncbi:MAG: type II-A CRISPR-associated protein Csn2 [Mycoplasmataceae bacterium]|jgi:CRISPR type II-A-associated protein Csn2|nr:type II-A CRISPR-associated protein Csn2 [Mycoplasmataceae bacterium]